MYQILHLLKEKEKKLRKAKKRREREKQRKGERERETGSKKEDERKKNVLFTKASFIFNFLKKLQKNALLYFYLVNMSHIFKILDMEKAT